MYHNITDTCVHSVDVHRRDACRRTTLQSRRMPLRPLCHHLWTPCAELIVARHGGRKLYSRPTLLNSATPTCHTTQLRHCQCKPALVRAAVAPGLQGTRRGLLQALCARRRSRQTCAPYASEPRPLQARTLGSRRSRQASVPAGSVKSHLASFDRCGSPVPWCAAVAQDRRIEHCTISGALC